MAMSGTRAAFIVLGAMAAVTFACGALEGGDDSSPTADGGTGGSDATADAAPADGAGSDAAASPCSVPRVLVGSDVTMSTLSEMIPSQEVHAYGVVAKVDATAACAWLYVDPTADPSSREIAFGVYSSDGGAPATLLATARFHDAGASWNAAPLSAPVQLGAGTSVWIAAQALDDGGVIWVRDHDTCPAAMRQFGNVTSALPATFPPSQLVALCDVAAYLGP